MVPDWQHGVAVAGRRLHLLPEAVVFGGVTYVFGIGRDNAVWYRTLGSGWISLGGYATSDVAVSTDGSSLHLLVRGGDGALWTRQLAGSTWLPWQYLGGVIVSYPSTAFLSNAGYVFVIGADNAVWYQRVQAGSWSGWQGLGGIALSAPAAAQDPNGGIDVFMVGADLAMYSRRLTAQAGPLGKASAAGSGRPPAPAPPRSSASAWTAGCTPPRSSEPASAVPQPDGRVGDGLPGATVLGRQRKRPTVR